MTPGPTSSRDDQDNRVSNPPTVINPSEPKNSYNGLQNIMDGTAAAVPGAPVGYVYDYANGAGTGIIRATVQDGVTIFGH